MYQFIHTECFGINSSSRAKNTSKAHQNVSYIVNEAIRDESAIPHLKEKGIDPQPPIYLYGEPLEQLKKSCEEWANSMTDSKGRKLRKDALTVLSGVISAQNTISEEDWESFKNDAISWLKIKYGKQLKTVVEHTDEEHPHLHFYIVPDHGKRFETIHQGREASAYSKAQGEKKSLQNKAYKKTMREYQDEFNEVVAAKYGMARIGPGKRRLSREAWKLEQVQARHAGKLLHRAEKLVSTAKTEVTEIKQTAKKEAMQIKAKAVKSIEIAERKGFEAGLDKVEKMSWFKRLNSVFSRAVVERNDLKSELETLKAENSESSEKADTFLKRAKKYFKTAKSFEAKIKKIEPIANSAQRHKKEAAKLKNEVKDLGDALALSRSRVQHLEAAYLKPEKPGKTSKDLGKVLDPTLSESRARQACYEAESYSM